MSTRPVSTQRSAPRVNEVINNLNSAIAKIEEKGGGRVSSDFKYVSKSEMFALVVRSFFRFDNHATLKLQVGRDVVAQNIRAALNNGNVHLEAEERATINRFLTERLASTDLAIHNKRTERPVRSGSSAAEPTPAVAPLTPAFQPATVEQSVSVSSSSASSSSPVRAAPAPVVSQEVPVATRAKFEGVRSQPAFNVDFKNFKNALLKSHFAVGTVAHDKVKTNKAPSKEEIQAIVDDLSRMLEGNNLESFKLVNHEKRLDVIQLVQAVFTGSSTLSQIPARKELLRHLKTMVATLPNPEFNPTYVPLIRDIKGLCVQFGIPNDDLKLYVPGEAPKPVVVAPVAAPEVKAPAKLHTVDQKRRELEFQTAMGKHLKQLKADFESVNSFGFSLDSKEGKSILLGLETLAKYIIENKDLYNRMTAKSKQNLQTAVINLQRALGEKGVRGNHPIFVNLNQALYL